MFVSDPSALQDAFHYALAACGGTASAGGSEYEGVFHPRRGDGNRTRSQYLKAALREAGKAFAGQLDVSDLPRNLSAAPTLVERIFQAAKSDGYCANGGVKLCSCCNDRQAEHGFDGLCPGCYNKANAAPTGEPIVDMPPPVDARRIRDAIETTLRRRSSTTPACAYLSACQEHGLMSCEASIVARAFNLPEFV